MSDSLKKVKIKESLIGNHKSAVLKNYSLGNFLKVTIATIISDKRALLSLIIGKGRALTD